MSDILEALIANDARQPFAPGDTTSKLLEGLRLSIRQGQLDLMANPDPSSPWWFLVDPEADFSA